MHTKGGTHNILVISDIHLGEDLAPNAGPQVSRDLRRAERHLIEFLGKYTRRRADGRPWRLVINGDMVDFLGICVFPDQDPTLGHVACSADEREHGLERRKDAACAKVRAVLDHHVEFFRALARFVATGNAVEIICGNHDTEFYWPEVQDVLRQGVARLWHDMPASARPGAVSATQVGEAIGFHPWFYYEPGVAWIEHGHQYDECCSFEYNLHPVDSAGNTIVSNVDTAGMRYITNQNADVMPHVAEEWSFAGYMRLVRDMGVAGAWRLARGYGRFTAKMVSEWRAAQQAGSRRQRRARHLESLRALSRQTPLSEATLSTICSMQRAPVFIRLRRLLQVLMLDKLLLHGVTFLLIALALLTLPLAWTLVATAGVVMSSRWLDTRLSRGRSVDAALPLQIVPSRILEHVDARFVVFGHTHLPVAQSLCTPRSRADGAADDGAAGGVGGAIDSRYWYFNTGTWVPSGKQGLLRSFTHLVIRHGRRGVEASLCQWRDGASRAFAPDWTPVKSPAPVVVPGAAGAARPPAVAVARRALNKARSTAQALPGAAAMAEVKPDSNAVGAA